MRLLEHSIQKTVIYNRLLTEPDTRCRAMMKEGECHVTRKTKRILASMSGVQRKNENQGPERYHVGELSSVLPEMQSCNESRLRKIEYGVERRSRRIDAGQDKAINERRNDRENPLCILVAVAM